MAVRPVFASRDTSPFVRVEDTEFQYFQGFAVSQKRKCIQSLHNSYLSNHPEKKILEISSKSEVELGVQLSAFNLQLVMENEAYSVECAYQSSKVFETGGPFVDILYKTSREAKGDMRLQNSGALIGFRYLNQEFGLEPVDGFYNWLWINALNSNKDLSLKIMEYDSFTDIVFNPKKSCCCQAKAAAIFVGLKRKNLLSKALEAYPTFLKIVYD